MDASDNITDLRAAITEFVITRARDLPQEVFQKLMNAIGETSAVPVICNTAEILYANRHMLNQEASALCARLCRFAALAGFFGFDVEDRGALMIMAVQRDAEVKPPPGLEWPLAENDPEARVEHICVSPEAAVAAPIAEGKQ